MFAATPSLLAALFVSSPPAESHEASFPELHLKLTIPAMDDFKETKAPDTEGAWSGSWRETQIEIAIYLFEADKFRFGEPGDVVDFAVDFYREQAQFDVIDSWYQQGSFGFAEFASVVKGALPQEDGEPGGVKYMLGGLLEKQGYLVDIDCFPAPPEGDAATLETFLKEGIVYDGPVRDPNWTDEEALARWLRDAPDDLHEDFQAAMKKSSQRKKIVIRTKHYLVLTNASGGASFAKKAEGYYDEIRKMYPFPDVDGRRLMPIFLFRSPDQYYDYYVKIAGTSRESAAKSKGHAWRDYYATWYEAPNDPVHIHEMTHQVFSNRLHLGGGGSWFQEGVAEYIETSENDRNDAARRVKKGEHVALREFVGLESLLGSSEEDVRGRGGAGDAYKQAALLIEFLRESKLGKDKFQDFLQTVGKVSRGNVEKIEAAIQSIYGLGLDELDLEWQKYCSKR